jgi:Protein of unknown function (DUF3089)
MARKFLYIIASLITLVIVLGVSYRLFGGKLISAAMVPTTEFAAPAPQKTDAYADGKMWVARPDLTENPSKWLPEGVEPTVGKAAVFFIHPTSYINRAAWNAPLDDQEANDRAALFVRGQASAFTAAGDIWAPRYAQATFGAFLTEKPEGQRAIEAAYRDVLAAFDSFIAAIPADRPVILAGHSQGALHLTRLLKERVSGQPLAKRIVAAYVVGWPVSVEADIPALGLAACTNPDMAGCVLSWQSFAEPAETEAIKTIFEQSPGWTGKSRTGTTMLCTNPLSGALATSSPALANLGTTVPSADMKNAQLVRGLVPAHCNSDGFLLIGDPPEMGPYVLPGNNYHVYDYSLFWANVRADAVRRLQAFVAK